MSSVGPGSDQEALERSEALGHPGSLLLGLDPGTSDRNMGFQMFTSLQGIWGATGSLTQFQVLK